MVYRYPNLSQMHNTQSVRITQSYTGMPGGGGASRTTESVAIKHMSNTNEREFEAVRLALRQLEGKWNNDERLKFIELVYWKRVCNFRGAARRLHVSYSTVWRWNRDFIRQVGFNFGFD